MSQQQNTHESLAAASDDVAAPSLPPPPPPRLPRARSASNWQSRVSGTWRLLSRSVLGLVFPPKCAVCLDEITAHQQVSNKGSVNALVEEWICEPCVSRLARFDLAACSLCAMPLPTSVTPANDSAAAQVGCVHCRPRKALLCRGSHIRRLSSGPSHRSSASQAIGSRAPGPCNGATTCTANPASSLFKAN